MEVVREPEVIRLYREDEVVELVANYLLANKKHEQERQRKQKVKQIVSRQRKRQLLKGIVDLISEADHNYCFYCTVSMGSRQGDRRSGVLRMYLMAAPIALGMIYQLIKGNWR